MMAGMDANLNALNILPRSAMIAAVAKVMPKTTTKTTKTGD